MHLACAASHSRHIGFFCDVVILYPGTLYYVANIELNFHLDWISAFLYTWSFMFHDFGWKLPIQGQIFKRFGVNRSFSFYNPKLLSVKVRPGVSSLRWFEKK